MKANDYLDLAQKKTGLRNDNQLCLMLGWSKSKVNNYRHNRQFMDNEAARELSEIVGVEWFKIVADMEAERQKDPARKKAWRKLSKLSSRPVMFWHVDLNENWLIACIGQTHNCGRN